ncbi:helix-turn-helix domain-containing protein [Patescibacteria group bacterium]|nr:helix-turn-helix domain-containing protein [Patescibacteria group bacterium]
MNIATTLKNIGFDDNKARVYQALLSLGTAPAGAIAAKSGIVRSTVYKILEELISDGLAENVEGKVKKFIALHPSALIRMLENKKTATENILPELLGIFTSPKFKPRLKFYEGLDGKKKVFADILTLQNDIVYTFSPIQEILTVFGKTYSKHFTEKRVKNKIWRYALRSIETTADKTKEWEFYGSDEKLMRQIRFLPPKIKCDTLIQIYADKISVVASHNENYAFIIESKELSGLMKQLFLWLWNTADKPSQ